MAIPLFICQMISLCNEVNDTYNLRSNDSQNVLMPFSHNDVLRNSFRYHGVLKVPLTTLLGFISGPHRVLQILALQ